MNLIRCAATLIPVRQPGHGHALKQPLSDALVELDEPAHLDARQRRDGFGEAGVVKPRRTVRPRVDPEQRCPKSLLEDGATERVPLRDRRIRLRALDHLPAEAGQLIEERLLDLCVFGSGVHGADLFRHAGATGEEVSHQTVPSKLELFEDSSLDGKTFVKSGDCEHNVFLLRNIQVR